MKRLFSKNKENCFPYVFFDFLFFYVFPTCLPLLIPPLFIVTQLAVVQHSDKRISKAHIATASPWRGLCCLCCVLHRPLAWSVLRNWCCRPSSELLYLRRFCIVLRQVFYESFLEWVRAPTLEGSAVDWHTEATDEARVVGEQPCHHRRDFLNLRETAAHALHFHKRSEDRMQEVSIRHLRFREGRIDIIHADLGAKLCYRTLLQSLERMFCGSVAWACDFGGSQPIDRWAQHHRAARFLLGRTSLPHQPSRVLHRVVHAAEIGVDKRFPIVHGRVGFEVRQWIDSRVCEHCIQSSISFLYLFDASFYTFGVRHIHRNEQWLRWQLRGWLRCDFSGDLPGHDQNNVLFFVLFWWWWFLCSWGWLLSPL